MRILASVIMIVLVTTRTVADDALPGVVAEFCALHFPAGIAEKGQPFNATDVVDGKPARRIVAYLVASSTAYLWYEHGGRGYHQHLVRFETTKPKEVSASYVFVESPHSSIDGLISDEKFLSEHVAHDSEL